MTSELYGRLARALILLSLDGDLTDRAQVVQFLQELLEGGVE